MDKKNTVRTSLKLQRGVRTYMTKRTALILKIDMRRILFIFSRSVLIIALYGNMQGMNLSCFVRIDNDEEFCDSLERLIPELYNPQKEELRSFRESVPVSQYAFFCHLYAKNESNRLKHKQSEIDLKCDSILAGSLLYFLQEGKTHDENVIGIFYEYAQRLYELREFELSKGFCMFNLMALENHKIENGDYYLLQSLDCALRFEENPDSCYSAQYSLFKILRTPLHEGLESEYTSIAVKDDIRRRLTDQYVRMIEMSLRTNHFEVADSLINEFEEFIYHRAENTPRGVSVVIETSPSTVRLNKLKADYLHLTGSEQQSVALKHSLLWRYYENWIMGNLSVSDFTDYFEALAYLMKTSNIKEKEQKEFLGQAIDILQDYIGNLSPFVQANLRNYYYEQAQALIYNLNGVLLKSSHPDDIEALYDNALLFKGLRLSVASAEHQNMESVRFEINERIKDPILSFTQSLVRMHSETWSAQRRALEKADISSLLQLNWKNVKASLSDNSLAIEFIKAEDSDKLCYYAIVTSKDKTSPKLVKLGVEEDLKVLASTQTPKRLKAIYQLIWKPILKFYPNASDIYFSPDGILHQLPLESAPLIGNTSPSGRYNFYRLSSTKLLTANNQRPPIRKALVYGGLSYDMEKDAFVTQSVIDCGIVAHSKFREIDIRHLCGGFDSLKYTLDEVKQISNLFRINGVDCRLVTGQSGTEASFKNSITQSYDVIHLSTHGFFWDEETVAFRGYISFLQKASHRSHEEKVLSHAGVVFSGANITLSGESLPDTVEDGILTADEISHLRSADVNLVVLSTCQSALGEISGEGVFGLQRGFKMAGAKSLLMSLWKVDDKATSMLMIEFYKHLLAGETKVASLTAAQQYVRSHIEYESPKYWAAFILLDALN